MIVRWLAFVSLCACSSPQSTDGPTLPTTSASAPPIVSSTAPVVAEAPRELAFDVKSFDFETNKDLAKRIAESPHAYYRFINQLLSVAVCKRFAPEIAAMPKVRLHGDAHVEQYAVTALGRGLMDYDDASIGPAVMDLERFATSLVLALRVRGAAADPDFKGNAEAETKIIAHFVEGYRAGLAKPALPATSPAFADALKAKFDKGRGSFLEMTDKNMVPLGAADEAFVKEHVAKFEREETQRGPKRPAGFYTVKRLGALKLGIGSALGRKYLVRLEGPKKTPDDDVILELKEISDRSNVPCVTAIPSGAADARRELQEAAGAKTLLSAMLLPDSKFWVNEWFANYEEVRIKKLSADADLREIAFEAGVLLAIEHQKKAPEHQPPAASSLAIDEALAKKLDTHARELANATVDGWRLFQKEVPVEPTTKGR